MESKVIGGRNVIEGERPWQVYVDTGNVNTDCGGTLISIQVGWIFFTFLVQKMSPILPQVVTCYSESIQKKVFRRRLLY